MLDMQAADPDFSVAYGKRPRLWPCPDASGGLLALERRWQSLFSNKCVLLRARSRSARRGPPEAAAAALPASAVTGRVHPLERAAVAAALRGQPVDAFADASDALMRGVLDMPLQQPPWRTAYESLRLSRLDRLTSFLAGGCCMVRCGAVRRLCCGARWARCRSCGLRCAAQPRPALGMRHWRGHRWSPCRTSLCIALWCGRLLLGCVACGPCLWLAGCLRLMPGSCSLGTTLCGTPAVVRPGLSCGPTFAFCSAVRFGTCAAAEWPMAKCSLLLLWWL